LNVSKKKKKIGDSSNQSYKLKESRDRKKEIEFTEYINECYVEILRDGALHCSAPGNDSDYEKLWESLPPEEEFELMPGFTNFDWLNPDHLKHKPSGSVPYQSCKTEVETQAYLQCYRQQVEGKYPGLQCTEVEKLGYTLHTNSSTHISKGGVITPYTGEVFPAAFVPSEYWADHKYADKILSYIPVDPEKYGGRSNREVVLCPGRTGGIAHFALSASNATRDYLNVNCTLMGKVLVVDGEKRVIYFLVAIKDIPPNTLLIWFYGFAYDWKRLKYWIPTGEAQAILEQTLLQETKNSIDI
jgi:hypothetical protein